MVRAIGCIELNSIAIGILTADTMIKAAAVELLTARRGSLLEAHHEAMECLGRMMWESQRAGRPPDGNAYVDCVQRRATRD